MVPRGGLRVPKANLLKLLTFYFLLSKMFTSHVAQSQAPKVNRCES